MKKIQNRSDGDYYPANPDIRNIKYQMGIDSEKYWKDTIYDNELVEQKTEGSNVVFINGNIFVEMETLFSDKKEYVVSGFPKTKSGHQFRAFKDDETGEYLPYSFSITSTYLNYLIERGMKEGWVQYKTSTPLPDTKDITKGYVIPFVRIFESFFLNTPDSILEPLLQERKIVQESKRKPTEMERNNRVKEVRNGKN